MIAHGLINLDSDCTCFSTVVNLHSHCTFLQLHTMACTHLKLHTFIWTRAAKETEINCQFETLDYMYDEAKQNAELTVTTCKS